MRVREVGDLDHVICSAIEELRDVVGPMKKTVDTLEQRDGLRTAARLALQEAGHRDPKPEQIDRAVDEFVLKRFTARFADKPAAFTFGPGCTIKCPSGRVISYDELAAERAKAATTIADPQGWVQAKSRHIENIDKRLKRLERGGES